MGKKGRRESMSQNLRLRIHRDGDQKFPYFAYLMAPNQKRVIRKLVKPIKPSYSIHLNIDKY